MLVNSHGVEQLLSGLKLHKASGPDMIPTYLLKLLAHQLAPVLALLNQASLDQGQLLEDWKTANVLPIFKKGNRSLQYHLPAYAARSWNTLSILTSYTPIACQVPESISRVDDHERSLN